MVFRTEDPRFLSGRGTYIDDIKMERIAHVAFLRSAYSHARIRRIDYSRATHLPGVIGVYTGEDYRKLCKPFPPGNYYPIALEKVRFVGEPLLAVVASSKSFAQDALELIDVEYDRLDPVLDAEDAMKLNAPILHDDKATNVAWKGVFEFGDFELAKKQAYQLLTKRFYFPRYSSTPIEGFAVLADYNPASDVVSIWSNTQGINSLRAVSSSLNVPREKLRFFMVDNGGAFGIKSSIYPYVSLIAAISMKYKIPVKWTETRTEHLAASSHHPDRVCYAEAAVTSDGKLSGLALKIIDNVGAYLRIPEPGNILKSLPIFSGCYKIPNIRIEGYSVNTNKCPTGPNRGFGGQHHYFVLERLVDHIAKAMKMDGAEFRKRNFIQPSEFPYQTPTGSVYDSGDYQKCLDIALESIDYYRLNNTKEKFKSQGQYLGIGIACIVEPSVANLNSSRLANPNAPESQSEEAAVIQVDKDGTILASLGSCPQGQGHETVATQLIAEGLSMRPEEIKVIGAFDSEVSPWAMTSGTYSSRFSIVGVGAIIEATRLLREKLLKTAAEELGTPTNKAVLNNGIITFADGSRERISMRDLAARISNRYASADYPLKVRYVYPFQFPGNRLPDRENKLNAYGTYGCTVIGAVVSVDGETGKVNVIHFVAVSDCGKIINEMIVKGQVHGASAHGMGGSIYEELQYDAEGQLLSSSFTDYLVPTAIDLPNIEVRHVETPSPFSPVGSKGTGEGAAMCAPAAIASAVEDALSDFNAQIVELPLSPEKVWQILRDLKRKM